MCWRFDQETSLHRIIEEYTGVKCLFSIMLGDHSPKRKRHRLDSRKSSNDDCLDNIATKINVDGVSNDVLCPILMRNNEKLEELHKIFQCQFNENCVKS